MTDVETQQVVARHFDTNEEYSNDWYYVYNHSTWS
jgi:hypothetical protein